MARNVRFSEMSLDELLTEMHRMELIREDDFNVNDEGYGREIRVHKLVLRELKKSREYCNQRTFVPMLNVSYPNYCTTTVQK